MSKAALTYLLTLVLSLSFVHAAQSATCYGHTPCMACKNCKYCKYCAKQGGTCGVCKPGKSKPKPPTIGVSPLSSLRNHHGMKEKA